MDEEVDFVLYELLDHHVSRFASLYVQALRRYEALQDRLLQHPSNNLSTDILSLRRGVMHMHKIIHPEQEIFVLLKSAHVPYISSRHRPYFEDVASRAAELSEDVDNLLEGLSEMVQSYTGMQSNEINKIMKFLTIVSVLALPATTVASIYGMNFYIPEIHWHYGYWYSLIIMLLVTMLLLLYMRRKRWLR
jgi:magnesium transporter